MSKKNRIRWQFAALAWLPFAALAQPTVWRCGNSYSQQPCAGGVAMDAPADRVPPEEAARAAAATRRDARMADEMEKTRRAQEKDAAPAVVIGKPREAASAPQNAASGARGKHKSKRKGQQREPEHFTATAPAPAGAKKTKK